MGKCFLLDNDFAKQRFQWNGLSSSSEAPLYTSGINNSTRTTIKLVTDKNRDISIKSQLLYQGQLLNFKCSAMIRCDGSISPFRCIHLFIYLPSTKLKARSIFFPLNKGLQSSNHRKNSHNGQWPNSC